MKKFEIIKEHKDFDKIIGAQKFFNCKVFRIFYFPNNLKYPRFGIAVSTKTGNAVIRNYCKRITRNMIDQNKLLFKNGLDYIIMIKKELLNLDYETSESILKEVMGEKNDKKI